MSGVVDLPVPLDGRVGKVAGKIHTPAYDELYGQ